MSTGWTTSLGHIYFGKTRNNNKPLCLETGRLNTTANMTEKMASQFSNVVIIGAGFSGIDIACQLQRKLGSTDYVVYDRASALGGAWTANRCKYCSDHNPSDTNVLQILAVVLTYQLPSIHSHGVPIRTSPVSSLIKRRFFNTSSELLRKITSHHARSSELSGLVLGGSRRSQSGMSI